MQHPQHPYGQPPQATHAPQPGTYPYGPMHGQALQPLYRQNGFVPAGASTSPLLGTGLRKAKLALGVLQVVFGLLGLCLFGAGIALGRGPEGPESGTPGLLMGLGGGAFLLWYMALFVYGIIGMIWSYKFWSWIPPEQRHTSMWKKYVSPGQAIGFMFIPYFNIYWMFVVYLGIAEILERMRVAYPTTKGPAKNLALMRLIVPFVFFPAGPFLDYFFDKHVEEMAAEMQTRMLPPTV